jgi:hypothetical protein
MSASRPLYPQKQTFIGVVGMSAKCHKQTFAKCTDNKLNDRLAEEVAKGHIGFNLRFTKTRRRKPSNAEDFKEVYIELRDGAWFHREPEEAATGCPNKSEEIAMKALRQANLEVDGDVPESAWRKCAYQLGISDSDNEDSRRAAFRRASKALVASGKVIKRDNKYTIAD